MSATHQAALRWHLGVLQIVAELQKEIESEEKSANKT